jgi:hypothetical protein
MTPAYSKLKDEVQVADCCIYHMESDPHPIKFMKSERAAMTPDDVKFLEFEYRLGVDENLTKMMERCLTMEMPKCGVISVSSLTI